MSNQIDLDLIEDLKKENRIQVIWIVGIAFFAMITNLAQALYFRYVIHGLLDLFKD